MLFFVDNIYRYTLAGTEVSALLGRMPSAVGYQPTLAEEMGVHFFDAGAVAKADKTDGGHLDAENTKATGTALVPVVKRILNI